jgi:hypothetical protein
MAMTEIMTERGSVSEIAAREAVTISNYTSLRATFTRSYKDASKLGVESIITKGRVLIKAKERLHGEFLDWLKNDLRLDVSKAERLMLIAGHKVLSDSAHWAELPPSWRTLYELTKLCRPQRNPQRMLGLIASGKIHPCMTRADARELLDGRRQDDGQLILSRELDRFFMRVLDKFTPEQAIANLLDDPGRITKASLCAHGHYLLKIAEELE